jgi:cation diffusion facilitator CzcD-associated flavoprotein CzcO
MGTVEGMRHPIVIVGSGFAGLCMAIRLRQAGITDFVVLEKGDDVGGTWRDNTYPGCACDVESHLYSFSFEPNPRWSRMFAPQGEILEYLKHCADKYGIRPHIRFRSEVLRAEFIEREGRWRIETRGGDVYRARYVILGIGALSRPAFPEIPGRERFAGRSFHSAEWDHSYSFAGKRVAVVGTGASAIQIVPQLAKEAGRLTVYQRTPPWIVPKPDYPFSERAKEIFDRSPLLHRLFRSFIYLRMELQGLGFTVEPRLQAGIGALGRWWLRKQVSDPVLREQLTPKYAPGCKRVLIANDYYPALQQPNVEVVPHAIREVTERGLVSEDGSEDGSKDGVEREFDALVFATGFRVSDLLTPMSVRGLGGVELNAAWQDGASAYLGTTISGFPNLFMLMGPNTGLGHNSMIFMIEAQIDYALRCIRALEERGAAYADVQAGAQSAFNEELQRRLRHKVWASGCKSWYLDESGRNRTLWPGFTFEFWLRTRRVRTRDYAFVSPPL